MAQADPGRRIGEETAAVRLRLVDASTSAAQDSPATGPPDVVALYLGDTTSEKTRAARALDLKYFFGDGWAPGDPDSLDRALAFAARPAADVAELLQRFKADQIRLGLSEATINRRLAHVCGLLRRCHLLGLSQTDGRGLVRALKVEPYRDTRGIPLRLQNRLLCLPDAATEKGARDLVVLRLALELGLRAAEICALDVRDCRLGAKELKLRAAKGKGKQSPVVDLPPRSVAAIRAYLKATARRDGSPGPLLLSCNHRPEARGRRLSQDGLYKVIRHYGERIGVTLSPHRLRHSAITQAVKAARGDLTAVQDFTRHADVNTVRRYNDNAGRAQGKIARKLSRQLNGSTD